MTRPAVFLDRDDTLIVDSGFVDDPAKVRLAPGAASAVRQLGEDGYVVLVATNQSGVARGYFTESRLEEIHQRMTELLLKEGARLDGIYYCPYLDGEEATVERYRKESDLRKPAPGMLLKAAADHDLDLSRSWMVGDSARDIEAGAAAGCRTILIHANGAGINGSPVRPTFVADTLAEAVTMLREAEHSRSSSSPESGEVENSEVASFLPAEDRSEALLTEIRDLLDRQHRASLHDDFSIQRLVGTIVQMLALVVGVWGAVALFGGDDAHALVRFTLAGLLQLGVISLTLSHYRK
jgi:D-glycero-D-manno-heptose 1,7-bisphosphate phosphatase